MANEETIGFHKGAVDTLLKERQELSKILSIVEHYLKAHIEELKKLGVDIESEYKQAQDAAQAQQPQQPQNPEQPTESFSGLDDRIA